MATTDSITFPVKNQAFRIYGVIRSSATANPITGGLTTLAGSASLDGAAFAATGLTVTEIGTTGYFSVDIDATRMNVNALVLEVTCANANAIKFSRVINPIDMAEFVGKATDQTPKKLEQYISDIADFSFNKMTVVSGANDATMTLYERDGTTTKVTGTASDDGTTATRGELS